MLQLVRRLFSAEHALRLGQDFQKTLKHWFSIYPSGKAKPTTLMEQITQLQLGLHYQAVQCNRAGPQAADWNSRCWGPNPHILWILIITIQTSTNLVKHTECLLAVSVNQASNGSPSSGLSSLERNSARALWDHPAVQTKPGKWGPTRFT